MTKKEEKTYTTEQIMDNVNNIPEIILQQYELLYEMYNKGEFYGALYQVKDVLEVVIKLPIIAMLAIADKQFDAEKEHKFNINSKKYTSFDDFLSEILSKKISFGDLERFAKSLSKLDEEEASPEYKELFVKLKHLLAELSECYYKPINMDNNRNRISNWRNEVIGHGAVAADEARVKEELEPMLININRILDKSDYRGINIIQTGDTYVLSTGENGNNLTLDFYLNFEDDFEGEKHKGSYLFESFNCHNNKATRLDYMNNRKCYNLTLSERLAFLAKKFGGQKMASENKTDAVVIKADDEKAIMDMETKNLVLVSPFFEKTKELLAKDKGILLLRSARGTGKTVFSRMIINNFNKEYGDRYKLTYKNNDKIFAALGCNDDELYVCTYNFNNEWMNRKDSFMRSLEYSLDPGHTSDFVYRDAKLRFENELRHNRDRYENYSEYREAVASAFCRWLEIALEGYNESLSNDVKLLIVLDGIDEIPIKEDDKDVVNVVDFLDEVKLPEHVYVLVLMRTEDEWKMPDELKSCGFLSCSIDKNEFTGILTNYIEQNLNNISAREVEEILKISGNRILHVQAICDICKLKLKTSYFNSNKSANEKRKEILHQLLTDEKISLIESYMDSFRNISIKYYNELMRVLCILAVAKKPLSTRELYFLDNSVGDESPDFRFYAFLRDLRGFTLVDRINGMNMYSIANEEWKKQLDAEYFILKRKEVLSDMCDYVKNIMGDGINELDMAAIDVLIANDKVTTDVAVKILQCIEYDYENNIENFEKHIIAYNHYVDYIMYKFSTAYFGELRFSSIESSELYIYTRYLNRIIDVYRDNDIEREIMGVSGFNSFISNLNESFRDVDKVSEETIERLLYIFNKELLSLYNKDLCGKDVLYGYMLAIVEIWFRLIGFGLSSQKHYLLYELLACMRGIPKDDSADVYIEIENMIKDALGKKITEDNKAFFDVLCKQFEIIDLVQNTKSDDLKDKIEEVESSLLRLANNVKNDESISDNVRYTFFNYLHDFYISKAAVAEKDLKLERNIYAIHDQWIVKLLKNGFVRHASYVASLQVLYSNLPSNITTAFACNEQLKLIEIIRKTETTTSYDCEVDFKFNESMISYRLFELGDKRKVSCDSLMNDIQFYNERYYADKSNKIPFDIYVFISYYVKTAVFAQKFGFDKIVKECLISLRSLCEKFILDDDNNYSKVKYSLFNYWIDELREHLKICDKKFLQDYFEILVILYQKMEKDYADMVEKCSLACLENMLGDIGTRNINTGIRLFDRFQNEDNSDYEHGMWTIISKESVETVLPAFPGYPLANEGNEYYEYGIDSFREEHEILKLSSGSYFDRAYSSSMDYLYNFVMSSENDDLKKYFAESYLKSVPESRFRDYYDYKKCFVASCICEDYSFLISKCSDDIERLEKRLKDTNDISSYLKRGMDLADYFNGRNLEDNKISLNSTFYADDYLNMCRAYYFRSLCYKDLGKIDLCEHDSTRFKEMANAIKVSYKIIIQGKFEEYLIDYVRKHNSLYGSYKWKV